MKQPACDGIDMLISYVDIWSDMILIKQNVEFNRAYISRVAGNSENHIIEGGINQWEVKSEGLIQERNVLGNVSPVDSPNVGLINKKNRLSK